MTTPAPIELPKLESVRRLTPQQTAALAEVLTQAYASGMSLRAIASDTGRSYGWVHRTLTDAGVELRPRGSTPLNPPAGERVLPKAQPRRGHLGNS